MNDKAAFLVRIPNDMLVRKADAHLIAAAPEMLDTLKHIEFILENYKLSGYRADEISEKYLEMVRHAIAKAEGKES